MMRLVGLLLILSITSAEWNVVEVNPGDDLSTVYLSASKNTSDIHLVLTPGVQKIDAILTAVVGRDVSLTIQAMDNVTLSGSLILVGFVTAEVSNMKFVNVKGSSPLLNFVMVHHARLLNTTFQNVSTTEAHVLFYSDTYYGNIDIIDCLFSGGESSSYVQVSGGPNMNLNNTILQGPIKAGIYIKDSLYFTNVHSTQFIDIEEPITGAEKAMGISFIVESSLFDQCVGTITLNYIRGYSFSDSTFMNMRGSNVIAPNNIMNGIDIVRCVFKGSLDVVINLSKGYSVFSTTSIRGNYFEGGQVAILTSCSVNVIDNTFIGFTTAIDAYTSFGRDLCSQDASSSFMHNTRSNTFKDIKGTAILSSPHPSSDLMIFDSMFIGGSAAQPQYNASGVVWQAGIITIYNTTFRDSKGAPAIYQYSNRVWPTTLSVTESSFYNISSPFGAIHLRNGSLTSARSLTFRNVTNGDIACQDACQVQSNQNGIVVKLSTYQSTFVRGLVWTGKFNVVCPDGITKAKKYSYIAYRCAAPRPTARLMNGRE